MSMDDRTGRGLPTPRCRRKMQRRSVTMTPPTEAKTAGSEVGACKAGKEGPGQRLELILGHLG